MMENQWQSAEQGRAYQEARGGGTWCGQLAPGAVLILTSCCVPFLSSDSRHYMITTAQSNRLAHKIVSRQCELHD